MLWPSAREDLLAYGAQIVAAGITTMLGSFAYSQYYETDSLPGHVSQENFTHARCELTNLDLMTLFASLAEELSLKLVLLI